MCPRLSAPRFAVEIFVRNRQMRSPNRQVFRVYLRVLLPSTGFLWSVCGKANGDPCGGIPVAFMHKTPQLSHQRVKIPKGFWGRGEGHRNWVWAHIHDSGSIFENFQPPPSLASTDLGQYYYLTTACK